MNSTTHPPWRCLPCGTDIEPEDVAEHDHTPRHHPACAVYVGHDCVCGADR